MLCFPRPIAQGRPHVDPIEQRGGERLGSRVRFGLNLDSFLLQITTVVFDHDIFGWIAADPPALKGSGPVAGIVGRRHSFGNGGVLYRLSESREGSMKFERLQLHSTDREILSVKIERLHVVLRVCLPGIESGQVPKLIGVVVINAGSSRIDQRKQTRKQLPLQMGIPSGEQVEVSILPKLKLFTGIIVVILGRQVDQPFVDFLPVQRALVSPTSGVEQSVFPE